MTPITLTKATDLSSVAHSAEEDQKAHRSMSVPIDIQAVRARLEQQGGPQVWRSLEAVAETTEFKDYLHREFPTNASEWLDPVGRRSFMKLMSASMALAGVTACTSSGDDDDAATQ